MIPPKPGLKSVSIEVIEMQILNMVDVRKFLSKFGLMIYTGDRIGDLDVMKEEVIELFQAKLIEKEDFAQLMNIITKEERKYN